MYSIKKKNCVPAVEHVNKEQIGYLEHPVLPIYEAQTPQAVT